MKNNKLIEVTIGKATLTIGHKDRLGSLNQLFDIGNHYRRMAGKPTVAVKDWLRNKTAAEYIMASEAAYLKAKGDVTSPLKLTENHGKYALPSKLNVIKARRGRYGGTFAQLDILLRASLDLDADFAVECMEQLVSSNILKLRDIGGDMFNELRTVMTANMVMDKHDFITTMASLKVKLGSPDSWDKASVSEHEYRVHVQHVLIDMIKMRILSTPKEVRTAIGRIPNRDNTPVPIYTKSITGTPTMGAK